MGEPSKNRRHPGSLSYGSSWSLRRDGVERVEAERKTRAYMRSMPLWRDHPALAEA